MKLHKISKVANNAIVLLLLSISFYGNAQTTLKVNTAHMVNSSQPVNLNPDPNGDPWIVSGYTPPADSTYMTAEQVRNAMNTYAGKKGTSLAKRAASLPSRVNNTYDKYARPIFAQVGGSCGPSSRIGYLFAHEINSFYDRDGKQPANIYATHFSWFSIYTTKEEMVVANGMPNSVDYEGETYSHKYGFESMDRDATTDYGWMQGYENWHRAMWTRMASVWNMRLNSADNIQLLKQWLYDHNGDNSFHSGAFVGTGLAISGAHFDIVNGKAILRSFGQNFDHATTWSGYDDDIDCGNGQKGAFIMLNSWGNTWQNGGCCLVPYNLLLSTNVMNAEFHVVRKNYIPQRVMKITMNYSQRCNISLHCGSTLDINATTAQNIIPCHHFLNEGNAAVPMLGKWADGQTHSEPMEFGYDCTDLLQTWATDVSVRQVPVKYFLIIDVKSTSTGSGSVNSMSIMNYQSTLAGIETVCSQKNVTIAGAGGQTVLSVVVYPPSYKRVTGVSLSQTVLTMNNGESAILSATLAPTDASNKNVKWTSSNATVASVDQTGKVTAVSIGTATVTVTSEDGEASAPCVVTVNEATLVASAGPALTLIDSIGHGYMIVKLDGSKSVAKVGSITSYTWKKYGEVIATGISPEVNLAYGTDTLMLEITGDNGGKANASVILQINGSIENDLAFNKPVTATSSAFDAVSQAKAFDHNFQTFWASSNADQNPRIIVDLQKPCKLSEILLFARQDDSGYISCRSNFQIIASNKSDFSEYDTLASQGDAPFQAFGVFRATLATNKTYQYLAVTRSNNPTYFEFTEILAFGKDSLTASAGRDLTLTDNTGRGYMTVKLDGSKSIANEGTIASYIWKKGGVVIATGISPEVNLAYGTDTLILEVTGEYGGKTDDSVIVKINGSIENDIAFNKPLSATSFAFDAVSHAMAFDHNFQTFWASNPFDQNPRITVDLQKSYKLSEVLLFARQDGPGYESCRSNFQVLASNVSDFSVYDTLASQGHTPFQAFGVFRVTPATNKTYQYLAVTRSNNPLYFEFSEILVFDSLVSTPALNAKTGIDLLPSVHVGAKHTIAIKNISSGLNGEFVLIDLKGRSVFTRKFCGNTVLTSGSVAKGTYFYKLKIDNKVLSNKLILY